MSFSDTIPPATVQPELVEGLPFFVTEGKGSASTSSAWTVMENVADTYDLLIIGGGINGAAIARDAAGRGLSVLLVERDDLASHTSSEAAKMQPIVFETCTRCTVPLTCGTHRWSGITLSNWIWWSN
jgi:hypothetical protein